MKHFIKFIFVLLASIALCNTYISCGTSAKLLAGTQLTDEIQGCYIVNAGWYKNTKKPLNCKIILEGLKEGDKKEYELLYTLQGNFQIKAGEVIAIPIPAEKDIATYYNTDKRIYKNLYYRFIIGSQAAWYNPWSFLGKNVKIRIKENGGLYIDKTTSFPKYKKSDIIVN